MSSPDPHAAVTVAYERIERAARPEVWISLRERPGAVADAERIRRRLEAGEDLPLAGLTFAVKDNIDVAGMPTTAAHPAYTRTPARSATVVERLAAAGAVLVGKTNMDQFATGLVGARSPYGAVTSSVDPDRIAGGSSSGSAVAVGLGLVDFSIGTDTAGSGRVPAAFNAIVGLKPTLGLVPIDGVVPACPSYDCLSVFAADTTLAATVLAVAAGPSDRDPHSRNWPADTPLAAPAAPVVGIPRRADLEPLSPAMSEAFDTAVHRLESTGARWHEVDLRPFLDAAQLLYGGGLVAERAYSFGEFLAEHPRGADPSVATIAERARHVTGVEVVRDQQRLLELRSLARRNLRGLDALLLPTAPEHPTVTAVRDAPLATNSLLGVYTNFVNLMDMAAVAVPAQHVPGEGLLGVTFVVPAFHDQVAVDLASRFTAVRAPAPLVTDVGMDLAVFGAHMRGEPLNDQLVGLGARFVRDISTAPDHRMHLVAGGVPRPAVVRADGGAAMPGELWRLSPAALTSLLISLPRPMALGPVALSDGATVTGFTAGLTGGEADITHLGGWRAFRTQTQPAPTR